MKKTPVSRPADSRIGLLIALICNTVLLAVLYFALPQFGFPYMHYVYLALGGGLALWYVIYNKGFSRRVPPEQLPSDLSPVEKQALLEDGERRFRRSRWALTILIPILFVFLCDMIYLFIFPAMEEWFR